MEATFSNIYPSLYNIAYITFAAMIGIAIVKWLTAKYNVPFIKDLAASI